MTSKNEASVADEGRGIDLIGAFVGQRGSVGPVMAREGNSSLVLYRLARFLPARKPILIDLHLLKRESMLEQGTSCGTAGGADVAGGLSTFVKHDGLVFG